MLKYLGNKTKQRARASDRERIVHSPRAALLQIYRDCSVREPGMKEGMRLSGRIMPLEYLTPEIVVGVRLDGSS